MAYEFEDILKAICTEVTPSHANDFQKIYMLDTSVEAKLAYDVLIAFGFEAKVYHTPEKPSKLYISNPKNPSEQFQQQFQAAIAYAHTLKKIKSSLDDLCEEDIAIAKANGFTISFVNSQPAGKQILIQVSQDATSALSSPSETAPSPTRNEHSSAAPSNPMPAGVTKISSSQKRVGKKMKRPKEDDDFASGPAVGRGLYPAKILPEGGTRKHTLRQRIMLRMFGNFATSGYATLMWLVVAGVLFSFFVFAKGWLCYDFVAKKNNAWYCKDGSQMTAEEARRLKQQEEQKKLGLQPVEPQ